MTSTRYAQIYQHAPSTFFFTHKKIWNIYLGKYFPATPIYIKVAKGSVSSQNGFPMSRNQSPSFVYHYTGKNNKLYSDKEKKEKKSSEFKRLTQTSVDSGGSMNFAF